MLRPRSPQERQQSEADFRERVREVKERYVLSDIIGRKTALKTAGGEKKGLCFVHDEKSPSLYVNDNLGVFLCRGCGASGDLISAVMLIEKMDFRGAMTWLGAAELPRADPAKRIRAAAKDEADRSQREDDARQIWKQTIPLLGTPGQVYLAGRGITIWPPAFRFTRTWWWCNNETGETSPDLPAVIAMVQDDRGFSGIQRIFLKPNGTGKAVMRSGSAKMSLGRVRGGAVRLGAAAPEIVICEGPEDALSIAQERQGTSVWCALGTANMPQIKYPPTVRKIIIAAQNDDAADAATDAAAIALLNQGYMVDVRHPLPEFKDWNDQLCAQKRALETGSISPEQARREWSEQVGGPRA